MPQKLFGILTTILLGVMVIYAGMIVLGLILSSGPVGLLAGLLLAGFGVYYYLKKPTDKGER